MNYYTNVLTIKLMRPILVSYLLRFVQRVDEYIGYVSAVRMHIACLHARSEQYDMTLICLRYIEM